MAVYIRLTAKATLEFTVVLVSQKIGGKGGRSLWVRTLGHKDSDFIRRARPTPGVGLHSRLAISIEHGKNANILIFNS